MKMKQLTAMLLTVALSVTMFAGCGNSDSQKDDEQTESSVSDGEPIEFPLKETETLTGTISYDAGTESEPNNRTIFKRLQEATNVKIDWTAIQADQWDDKIGLNMANASAMTDFVFTANFSDSDLIRYADQEVIIPLEDYIDEYMPNLSAVFEKYPEYRTMCEDEDGHIWALPWIEQLGSGKTAIQTVGRMSFINKKWLDFLGLEVPETVDDFEKVLIAFRDNSKELQEEFGIEGSIIPLSFIMNDGGQDPGILINGFGEGYGDIDQDTRIAVTDDKKVLFTAEQEGFKSGVEWLHQLYEEDLIDPDAFTQDWSTYVAKGKSGRYGVCITWDIANVDNLEDWVPLPALTADVRNITPQNGSYTSGFRRGSCVVTSIAKNPQLVCAWLDQMYDPMQSAQNNWGTYGEDDDFDIFELSTNADGEPMLKHTELGDASPVEVRQAEYVSGPLAVLDDYYDVYVTCPDDAAYRLDWIEKYYTPDMTREYVYPNMFMNAEDTETIADLQNDLIKLVNEKKADWVMNGLTDKDWENFKSDLEDYGLEEYLEIYQKYLDRYFEE